MDPSKMQAKLSFVRLDALAQHIGRKVLSLYLNSPLRGETSLVNGSAQAMPSVQLSSSGSQARKLFLWEPSGSVNSTE